MLVHLRSEQFKPEYLKYVHQDPVHSLTESRSLDRRCEPDRNIFFWIENGAPTAVLCVAYIQGLTDDVGEILDVTSPGCMNADHAIFYSVFRTDKPTSINNTGATLIREAATWIRDNLPQIKQFVTMSPIPNLSAHFAEPPSMEAIMEFLKAQTDPVAKFHIRNGARILRVIPNADNSERRRTQSYGTMVNYGYTQNFIDPAINS